MQNTIKNISLKEIQKIEGWLSLDVMQLLRRLVVQMPSKSNVLEIGSWKGRSTITMASLLSEGQYLYAVDTFEGSQEHKHLFGKQRERVYEDFKMNLERFALKNRVVVCIGTINKAAKEIDGQTIGLIFIDGSHKYSDVLQDFRLSFSKLKANGYIAFHDAKWQGVKKVLWTKLYKQKNISLIRRLEDTVYVKKLAGNNYFFYFLNQLLLYKEKARQTYKRNKRKLRKKIKRLKNV